jgi:hypothetical protein
MLGPRCADADAVLEPEGPDAVHSRCEIILAKFVFSAILCARGEPEIFTDDDDDDDDDKPAAELPAPGGGLDQICTLALSSIEHIPPCVHRKIPTTGVEWREARQSRIFLSTQSNSNN